MKKAFDGMSFEIFLLNEWEITILSRISSAVGRLFVNDGLIAKGPDWRVFITSNAANVETAVAKTKIILKCSLRIYFLDRLWITRFSSPCIPVINFWAVVGW